MGLTWEYRYEIYIEYFANMKIELINLMHDIQFSPGNNFI